jgi:acetate kinase
MSKRYDTREEMKVCRADASAGGRNATAWLAAIADGQSSATKAGIRPATRFFASMRSGNVSPGILLSAIWLGHLPFGTRSGAFQFGPVKQWLWSISQMSPGQPKRMLPECRSPFAIHSSKVMQGAQSFQATKSSAMTAAPVTFTRRFRSGAEVSRDAKSIASAECAASTFDSGKSVGRARTR